MYLYKSLNVDIKGNFKTDEKSRGTAYIRVDNNSTTVNIKEDSRIKVNVGDVTILNTNDIYIDGETKTGTVKIYKNNTKKIR